MFYKFAVILGKVTAFSLGDSNDLMQQHEGLGKAVIAADASYNEYVVAQRAHNSEQYAKGQLTIEELQQLEEQFADPQYTLKWVVNGNCTDKRITALDAQFCSDIKSARSITKHSAILSGVGIGALGISGIINLIKNRLQAKAAPEEERVQ